MARAHIIKLTNEHQSKTLYLDYPTRQVPVNADTNEPFLGGRIAVPPQTELEVKGLTIPWGNEGLMWAKTTEAHKMQLSVYYDRLQSWDYIHILDNNQRELYRLDAGSVDDVAGLNHSGWELLLDKNGNQKLVCQWKQGLDYNAAVATICGVCIGAPLLLFVGAVGVAGAGLAIVTGGASIVATGAGVVGAGAAAAATTSAITAATATSAAAATAAAVAAATSAATAATAATVATCAGLVAAGASISAGVLAAVGSVAGIVGGVTSMACGVWAGLAPKSSSAFKLKAELDGVQANVAAGKPATASSRMSPDFSPDKANDGRSGGPGGWAPAADDLESWWKVDLGTPTSLKMIQLCTRQDIDDPFTRMSFAIEGIHVDRNGNETTSLLGEVRMEPGPHQSRLMLFVTDPTPFRYIKARKIMAGPFFIAALQAYARPLDLAEGRPASASSEYSSDYAAGRANDGSSAATGGWSPSAADNNSYWQVDLGVPQALGRIELFTRQDMDQPESRQSFAVWGSNNPDMSQHTLLAIRGPRPLSYREVFTVDVEDPTPYRYIRVVKTRPGYLFISKLCVYGALPPVVDERIGVSPRTTTFAMTMHCDEGPRTAGLLADPLVSQELGKLSVSGVFSPLRNHFEMFCGSEDGSLHYVFVRKGRWCADTSSFQTAGRVNGPISTVYSPRRKHSEAFFRGELGYLHHVYVENGAWKHEDEPFLPLQVAGDLSAVYSDAREHSEVFFRGQDGYLHYFFKNGTWARDSTTFQQAGQVEGAIAAVFSSARNHSEVFFRGADGFLHYFYVHNGGWNHFTFQDYGPIAGAVSAVYSPAVNHSEVFYRGTDRYLHRLHVPNGSWAHEVDPFRQAGCVEGSIATVYAPQRNHSEVFFRGEDGFLHYCYWNNGTWGHDAGTFQQAGRVLGPISAVFSSLRNHSEVSFRGEDGQIHFFYVKDGVWVHEQSFNGLASQLSPCTVASGDTTPGIANRFGVSLQDLQLANPQLPILAPLSAGQVLNIPGARIHTIQSGDTLTAIAASSAISVETLLAANPSITNPDLLFGGQQVIVPAV